MKYKVYIVKEGHEINEPSIFIESEFNYGCGFDDIEEAMLNIQRNGENYIHYTILPYIYLT